MYTTDIKACTAVSSPFGLCELNYQADCNDISMAGKYMYKTDNKTTLEFKPNLITIEMTRFPQRYLDDK